MLTYNSVQSHQRQGEVRHDHTVWFHPLRGSEGDDYLVIGHAFWRDFSDVVDYFWRAGTLASSVQSQESADSTEAQKGGTISSQIS